MLKQELLEALAHYEGEANFLYAAHVSSVLKAVKHLQTEEDVTIRLKVLIEQCKLNMKGFEEQGCYNLVEMEKDRIEFTAQYIPGYEYVREPPSEKAREEIMRRLREPVDISKCIPYEEVKERLKNRINNERTSTESL